MSNKLEVGGLVVIQSSSKLKEPFRSFHIKWEVPAPDLATWHFWMAPTMATAISTASYMIINERQTGEKIALKYYSTKWKPVDRIVGVVTEILRERHRDFDVIKIREQSGKVKYCRRYIVEMAQEAV